MKIQKEKSAQKPQRVDRSEEEARSNLSDSTKQEAQTNNEEDADDYMSNDFLNQMQVTWNLF